MNTPTLAQFKRFSADIAPAVRAVLMAQAHAELTREKVDAYLRPIFDRYQFQYAERWQNAERGALKGLIPSPHELYLCDDEPGMAAFYADCDDEHRRQGYLNLPKGHCPALRAENLLIQTERALLSLGSDLFGVDLADTYGETRRNALDLLIGASVKTGRVKA